MNVQVRRARRGAGRATPEDMLRAAIAVHRALKEREALRTGAVKPAASMRKPSRPAADPNARRRAQFARAIARSAFGRAYRDE
jgi:hypothetical protein